MKVRKVLFGNQSLRRLVIWSARKWQGRGRLVARSSFQNDLIGFDLQGGDPDEEIERFKQFGYIPSAGWNKEIRSPWKIDFPIDWGADPFDDRNWMFQLHSLRMLDPFIRRFSMEDVDFIQRVFEDLWSYEILSNSKWVWYDMAVGLRAMRIAAYIVQLVGYGHSLNGLGLEGFISKHVRHLTNPGELSRDNHGVFQMDGLMALCWAIKELPGVDLDAARAYASNSMVELLAGQLHADGFHTEDSPEYHLFIVKLIDRVIRRPWWENSLPDEVSGRLKKAVAVGEWIKDPLGYTPAVGDSFRVRGKSGGGEQLDVIPHAVSASGRLHLAVIGGYGIVRTVSKVLLADSAFLFFQGSFYSDAHKHADCLSFVWQEAGSEILIDGGKYGYQRDRWRDFFLSGRAHNTLTVDDESASIAYDNIRGSAISNCQIVAEVACLSGQVEHCKMEILHRRSIIYSPGEYLVVLDRVENLRKGAQRQVDLWWNFASHCTIDANGEAVTVFREGSALPPIRLGATSVFEFRFDHFLGYDDDFLAGWVSTRYLQREPSPALRCRFRIEESGCIITTFLIDPEARCPRFEVSSEGVFCDRDEFSDFLDFFKG